MKKKLSLMRMFENGQMVAPPEQGQDPFAGGIDIVQLAQEFKRTKDPQIGQRLMQILSAMATGGKVGGGPTARVSPKFGVQEALKTVRAILKN